MFHMEQYLSVTYSVGGTRSGRQDIYYNKGDRKFWHESWSSYEAELTVNDQLLKQIENSLNNMLTSTDKFMVRNTINDWMTAIRKGTYSVMDWYQALDQPKGHCDDLECHESSWR